MLCCPTFLVLLVLLLRNFPAFAARACRLSLLAACIGWYLCHNVPAPRVALSFQVLRCHLKYPGVAFHLRTCQAVSVTTPWHHLSDVLSVIACLGVTYLSRLLTAMSPFISRPAPVCSMPVVSCLVVASFTMRCQLIYHLVAPHLSSSHVMTPPLFFRFILHPAGSFVFCPLVM